MPSPAALPIEAREAAGRVLWQRLLAEPPAMDDDPELEEHEDGEPKDEAA
jgi:hypothetical protein